MMSREKILAAVAALPSKPVVIQALWDGDSDGWFVTVEAITADGQSHYLGFLRDGNDIRLFNGEVPPWPEAVVAREIGNEITAKYGAEFYFPSPDQPETDCPTWEDRDKSCPCRRCGIRLLQDADIPWQGICYFCSLDEEREQREAKWTQEERDGPRCHICGNPAASELNGGPVCAGCFDKYEVSRCQVCDVTMMRPKEFGRKPMCPMCEMQVVIDSLGDDQRNIIREAMARGRLDGLQAALDVMNCTVGDAQRVLGLLSRPSNSKDDRSVS